MIKPYKSVLLGIIVCVTFCVNSACSLLSSPEAVSIKTTAELIAITQDEGSAEFGYAVAELAKLAEQEDSASIALAEGIMVQRHDAYMAAFALMSVGTEGKAAIPTLLDQVKRGNEEGRRFSLLALGAIGSPAECALPEIARFLWDGDEYIRTASAAAIAHITQLDLVNPTEVIHPENPTDVFPDLPEGSRTARVRNWWETTGAKLDWTSDTDLCT